MSMCRCGSSGSARRTSTRCPLRQARWESRPAAEAITDLVPDPHRTTEVPALRHRLWVGAEPGVPGPFGVAEQVGDKPGR